MMDRLHYLDRFRPPRRPTPAREPHPYDVLDHCIGCGRRVYRIEHESPEFQEFGCCGACRVDVRVKRLHQRMFDESFKAVCEGSRHRHVMQIIHNIFEEWKNGSCDWNPDNQIISDIDYLLMTLDSRDPLFQRTPDEAVEGMKEIAAMHGMTVPEVAPRQTAEQRRDEWFRERQGLADLLIPRRVRNYE